MAFTVRSILPNHPDKLDFNGDGFTDLVWRGKDGSMVVWNKDASGIYGVGSTFIPNPDPYGNTLTLRGAVDVNNNGVVDLVWQDRAGGIQISYGRGDNQFSELTPLTIYGSHNYEVRGTGDFNGDGKTDLLWFVPPAPVAGAADGVWVTAGAENRPIPVTSLGPLAPFSIDLQLVGTIDFNGDGRTDILYRGTGNATVGWMMVQQPNGNPPQNGQLQTDTLLFRDPGPAWSVLALADFNGDGKGDIAWKHVDGAGQADAYSVWTMDGVRVLSAGMMYNPGPEWEFRGSGDYNNDGKTDLLAYHTPSGWYAEYLMDGYTVTGFGSSVATSGDFWTLGSV